MKVKIRIKNELNNDTKILVNDVNQYGYQDSPPSINLKKLIDCWSRGVFGCDCNRLSELYGKNNKFFPCGRDENSITSVIITDDDNNILYKD